MFKIKRIISNTHKYKRLNSDCFSDIRNLIKFISNICK